MTSKTISNIQDVKLQNRMLVLKQISMHNNISRIDIARITGLSKMTVGNLVTELLSANLVTEVDASLVSVNCGRKPIMLALSENSPCLCGILIKRELCQIILSDLGGRIFFRLNHPYTALSSEQELLEILWNLLEKCQQNTNRRILAIGIAALGPLDSTEGIILNPPYFYGIENLPIVSIVKDKTGLPVFLVNDATAGAFSEKLFGAGTDISNFVYLHIMNGIGAGFILNHNLYDGNSGQSGEIGHTSINFEGPLCACGNKGCLDLYANIDSMRRRIKELAPFYPGSILIALSSISFADIIAAGNHHDALAISVLEEFCSYIASSLTNTINLLNLSTVIVGYDSANNGTIIEELLQHKLNSLCFSAKYHPLTVIHSTFNGDAPLIGSVALLANKIFNQQLPLDF